jgi:hypothetical protein
MNRTDRSRLTPLQSFDSPPARLAGPPPHIVYTLPAQPWWVVVLSLTFWGWVCFKLWGFFHG